MRLLACVSVAVCVSLLLLGRTGAEVQKCGVDEFRCKESDQCVRKSGICDGEAICHNGWDELNCTSCHEGSFLCDGSHCVDKDHRCDGVAWCRDGTDEANCTSMKVEPFCSPSTRCNGVRAGCSTKDDELDCTPDMCQAPASSSTYCDGRCLKASSWCDGWPDCSDGQDEARCPGRKSPALAGS